MSPLHSDILVGSVLWYWYVFVELSAAVFLVCKINNCSLFMWYYYED